MSGRYLVVLSSPSVSPDGSPLPAGTAFNRVMCDANWTPTPAVVPNCPAGAVLSLVADDGRALWQPPQPAPTTIGPYDFIQRFTPAEQEAIQKAAQGNWQIQLWMTQLAASGAVDVTSATLQTGLAALEAAGLLTSARAAQIVSLGEPSP